LPTYSTAARVLTVEDDPIVRADLRLILEDAGFDVVPDARDGVEAVEFAREHRPDLILIDLSLPNLDGVEATRQILDEQDVPIVALTGHSTGGLVERAIEAGVVAHVLKPFHESHLVETITDALADHAVSEAERRRDLILVEAMVRDGYSEGEIVAALRERRGSGDAVEPAGSFLHRLGAFFAS
jgi:two-component system, response regulator PdtaR